MTQKRQRTRTRRKPSKNEVLGELILSLLRATSKADRHPTVWAADITWALGCVVQRYQATDVGIEIQSGSKRKVGV